MEIKDIKDIETLIGLLEKSKFDKCEISVNDVSIKLEKGKIEDEVLLNKRVKHYEQQEKVEEQDKQQNITVIRAPIVGTFYDRLGTMDTPFVKIGEMVEKGQVIGVIEAMKLINEIESNVQGEVVEICIKNNHVIGYGEEIIKIKSMDR